MKDRIFYLRKYLGLSQTQFATRIHRTATAVSMIETGKMEPSNQIVEEICASFGVTEEWLRDGKRPMFSEGHETQAYDSEKIGSRILTLRKQLNLTAAQFAEALHCSKDQVYSVERGRLHPSMEWIQRVADTFHVNRDWLWTGSGEIICNTEDGSLTPDKIVSYLEENPSARENLVKVLREDPVLWEKIQT